MSYYIELKDSHSTSTKSLDNTTVNATNDEEILLATAAKNDVVQDTGKSVDILSHSCIILHISGDNAIPCLRNAKQCVILCKFSKLSDHETDN